MELSTRQLPFVTIVIPARNEEKYIKKCLRSIASNDYPFERLEVLVVDGRSNDKTRNIVREYSEKYSFVKLIDNHSSVAPVAMNIGIKNAQGDFIIILSSHAQTPENFIKNNVESCNKYNVDCIGGVIITMPANNRIMAQVIALTLSHPFGVGNSYFRTGSQEIRYVDTVPFGCYKKEVFKKIGLFDESLVRNQDLELNLRLKRAGGKILLDPNIVSYYYARSKLSELFRQNFGNGFWVIYSLKSAKSTFSLRHFIPFTFVFSLMTSFLAFLFYTPFIYLFILIASAYLILDITFSYMISSRKSFKYIPGLAVTFATLHVSYGLGSLWGFVKILGFK